MGIMYAFLGDDGLVEYCDLVEYYDLVKDDDLVEYFGRK